MFKRIGRLFVGITVLGIFVLSSTVSAQEAQGFSLQVSPSPMVATVQPGQDTTLELRIRNTNTAEQALKMGIKSFSIDESSGQVKLGNDNPKGVGQIVQFEDPTFTLKAGEIYTQRVHINVPEDAGFSYNFAITIAQQNPPKAAKGTSAIAGSVAVFTLINVDRPGAVRKFSLGSVSIGKHVYEYLPAEIKVTLKNEGNVDVQPTGTVFIQRHSSDTTPLASLPLNKDGGYVLPDTSRAFTATWNDGFPHYQSVGGGADADKQKLTWQGGIGKLRMGRYVAKVVAIYDDGQRDIPVMTELSFWVIPWRIILACMAVLAVLFIGIYVTLRSFGKTVGHTTRRVVGRRSTKKSDDV